MTYSYKCDNPNCKNHYGLTIQASMKNDALTNCPLCGCRVNQVFSNPMVKWSCSGAYGQTKHS